jgi:hypothetical protein
MCIRSEMEAAAAHAIVVRREHFLLHLRHRRRALVFLEAKRNGLVALELFCVGHEWFELSTGRQIITTPLPHQRRA